MVGARRALLCSVCAHSDDTQPIGPTLSPLRPQPRRACSAAAASTEVRRAARVCVLLCSPVRRRRAFVQLTSWHCNKSDSAPMGRAPPVCGRVAPPLTACTTTTPTNNKKQLSSDPRRRRPEAARGVPPGARGLARRALPDGRGAHHARGAAAGQVRHPHRRPRVRERRGVGAAAGEQLPVSCVVCFLCVCVGGECGEVSL